MTSPAGSPSGTPSPTPSSAPSVSEKSEYNFGATEWLWNREDGWIKTPLKVLSTPTTIAADIAYNVAKFGATTALPTGAETIKNAIKTSVPATIEGAKEGAKWAGAKAGNFAYDGTVRVLTPALATGLNATVLAGHMLAHLPRDALHLLTATPINLITGTARSAIAGIAGLGGIFSKTLKGFSETQLKKAGENFDSATDLHFLHNTGKMADSLWKGSVATATRIPQTYTKLIGLDSATKALDRAAYNLSNQGVFKAILGTRNELDEWQENLMGGLFSKPQHA